MEAPEGKLLSLADSARILWDTSWEHILAIQKRNFLVSLAVVIHPLFSSGVSVEQSRLMAMFILLPCCPCCVLGVQTEKASWLRGQSSLYLFSLICAFPTLLQAVQLCLSEPTLRILCTTLCNCSWELLFFTEDSNEKGGMSCLPSLIGNDGTIRKW